YRGDVRRCATGADVSTWAAILAGGSGTRFWPLSTPERPKQFLPLTGDRPLLAQTVARLRGLVPPERTLILTGPSLVDRVATTVPDVPEANIFAEPRAASTAPALAWAAHWIAKHDPGGQMLSLHEDWAVGDDSAFRAAATHALGVAAEQDVLVTVGIKPTRNETAYGYIVPGAPAGRARRWDARGNVTVGNVTIGDDVKNSVIWADSEDLAVVGIEDMVIVRANGYTLVMPTGRPDKLKALVQRL